MNKWNVAGGAGGRNGSVRQAEDACSRNAWPAGRRRAARVRRQRTELQREERRRKTTNNTD